ncbi:MAG: hypothetical protein IT335_16035 [Thermomicrobiales bacterium]|nr:hypothetical protein [Thermomicrobiales bacterium]
MSRPEATIRYELWHVGTANLIDDFEDEAEALAVTRDYLLPDERGEVVDVALVSYDKAGQIVRALDGDALATFVFGAGQPGARRSA